MINPNLLDIQIRAMERGRGRWGRGNLTNLMRHAVDQWTGSGIDGQNEEMKSADVVMLTANPMKRANYHFVVVAYVHSVFILKYSSCFLTFHFAFILV